jgi:hypothetical protein
MISYIKSTCGTNVAKELAAVNREFVLGSSAGEEAMHEAISSAIWVFRGSTNTRSEWIKPIPCHEAALMNLKHLIESQKSEVALRKKQLSQIWKAIAKELATYTQKRIGAMSQKLQSQP